MAVVLGSVIVGYTMHGGNLLVLLQINEYIVIGGAALGALLVGNKPSIVKAIFLETLALVRPSPYNQAAFRELLQVLYEVFYAARKDGLVGIESHVENPEESELFRRYPSFHRNHAAVAFLSDTMKVLLTGAVDDHHLSEILDLDLEQQHEEANKVPKALGTVADALPGFGIVAAVMGVIITMGKIGGSPEQVGMSVAAALVGSSWPTASWGPWPRPSSRGSRLRRPIWPASVRLSCLSPGAILPSPPWSSLAGTSNPWTGLPSPSSRI